MTCVFCEIIKGNIPSMKVYEDDAVLAFLSIGPVTKGHTLVVPKKHAENFVEMTDQQADRVFNVAKKIAPAVMKGSNATGFVLSMNNGPEAGQEVMHAHLHIIPRFKGDNLKSWPEGSYDKDEIQKYRNAIVDVLKQMPQQ